MTAAEKSIILVVEDEEESRETLRELLELEGYQVATAVNGQDALEQLRSIDPCIMLLDLFMPVMDGWQLLETLRADGRLARMTVVVTTSAAQNLPPGVPVFVKPLNLEHLIRTVDAVC